MMGRARVIRTRSHDEWIAERRKGVGASEVGAIIGVSPFQTPYGLWRLKKGLDQPQEETLAMKMGHELEQVVSNLFEEETGYRILKTSAADNIYIDPDYDYMRATPDRIGWLKCEDGRRRRFLLECKTTSKDVDEDSLPAHWIAQVQYQMSVTGIHTAYLAWLIRGRDFGFANIPYDEELVREIRSAVTDFWNRNVIGGEEPPVSDAGDVDKKYVTSTAEKSIEADSDAVADWQELRILTRQAKEIEAKADEIKDRLKVYMEDSESLTYEGLTLCTFRSGKPKTTFDAKAFRADNPELYQKYLKDGKPARPFLVKNIEA